jgi:hypothetical protein
MERARKLRDELDAKMDVWRKRLIEVRTHLKERDYE